MRSSSVIPLQTTPIPVHCLNCSTATGDSLSRWGVILACGALVVSLVALFIAAREHVVFVRELRKRADFELSMSTNLATDSGDKTLIPLVHVPGGMSLLLRVGIRNTGSKAAGHTTLNVLYPTAVSSLQWAIHQVGDGLSDTDEKLTTSDGTPVAANFLSRTIPRVALRTPLVIEVLVSMSKLPTDLPIKVVAQSDDLPDDVEERVLEQTYKFRKV